MWDENQVTHLPAHAYWTLSWIKDRSQSVSEKGGDAVMHEIIIKRMKDTSGWNNYVNVYS
jgi:hypothetical protein